MKGVGWGGVGWGGVGWGGVGWGGVGWGGVGRLRNCIDFRASLYKNRTHVVSCEIVMVFEIDLN